MIYGFWKVEHFFYKIKLVPLAIIVRVLMRLIFSCDIPYQVEIGEKTTFPHMALGVTIHNYCKIGKNCKILQNVTLGGRSGHKEVPMIGNNVLIGANACVLGPIKIGNNAQIGAGSVVIHDVKENEVVAGVPAKHIKFLEE